MTYAIITVVNMFNR